MAEPPIDSRLTTYQGKEGTLSKAVDLAIVLAAGEGTRMKSSLAKVLHPIAGKTVIHHVIDAVTPVAQELSVVVGAHREEVESHISAIAPAANCASQ